MPNKLFDKHPKKYGKGSRPCRLTGSTRAVIRKYGIMLTRQSFRERAEMIGFQKVNLLLTLVPLMR